MPPVNSAPSSEGDNEATAELPVLDVAAYESTLAGAEAMAHTDTWVLPGETFKPSAEATTEMPAVAPDSIPTLTQAVPAYDLDHSGTHEMPQIEMRKSTPRRADPAAAAASKRPSAASVAAQPALPPSPPLIEELRTALADAQRRVTELEERARIADAERAVALERATAESAQLRAQLGTHLEALALAQQRLDAQRTDETERANALAAGQERLAGLERELASRDEALAQARALHAGEARRREILECDVMNLRATVARRNEHIDRLVADMAARHEREQSLSRRLSEALASIEPNVPYLREEIAARDEQLREVKADLEQARARLREKDDDLQVAEESIRQLENELRDKTSKLEEASVTVEEWRAVIAESQRSILQRDSRIQQLEADIGRRGAGAAASVEQTGEEIALEGPARVLIRTDGNTDFVHVLGRRTRIGRGPDNEIVLDTKHVSRYHAVLLAGPVNTSIEDLNSTNGVFVNGKRVNRQVLRDGDRVMIGKSQFRYTVRD